MLARALIGRRQALQRVALLERVRGAEHLPVFPCVEAAVDAVEPGEQILAGPQRFDRDCRNDPGSGSHVPSCNPMVARSWRSVIQ